MKYSNSSFAAKAFVLVLSVAGAISCSASLAAAQAGPRARLTQAVDPGQLVTLTGNTHPLARAEFDRGAAPADLPMDRMLLVLKPSAGQQAALDALVAAQQDPAAAQYHHWLTPTQYGQQFGVAAEDIQTITNWLTSQGFTVNHVATGANVIEFSGTAGQVAASLHTQIHRYLVNGQSHWANATDPRIPTALSPVVAGVATLNNFAKHTGQVVGAGSSPVARPGQSVPALTDTHGDHALVPGDFAKIYNVSPLYGLSTPIDGTGQTIAVVGRSNIDLTDISDFRSLFLPSYPAQPVTVITNGADPGDVGGGDEAEADLDVEWSSGVAPNAKIDFVVSATTDTTDGVDLSQEYIVENNVAPVMTTSFSQCEAALGTSEVQFLSDVAEQAAAQGITVINSSGDSGAAECDDDTAAAAANGLAVNGLASTPFTTAVGGTMFKESAGTGPFWGSTASTSATNYASALGYIPETTWNESCSSAACGSNANLFASGGGASALFSKPTWQTMSGVPNDSARDLPDISFAAGSAEGYVVCQKSSGSSCHPSGGSFSFQVFGGTSGSAPSFAGVIALVNQKTGASQGLINTVLYNLARKETYGSCNAALGAPAANCTFFDTTTGNNSVPCASGSLGCTTTGGSSTLIGYNAGVGYDQTTGLGSMNVSNLVTNWASGTATQTASVTLSLSSTKFTHGQPITFQVQVSPNIGPTGDVVLLAQTNLQTGANGYAVDAFTIGDGSCTSGSNVTTCVKNIDNGFPGGSYNLIARYEGDANFGPNVSNSIAVTVAAESSTTGCAAEGTFFSNVCVGEFDSVGDLLPVTTAFYGDFLYPKASVFGNAFIANDFNVDDGVPTGTVTFKDGASNLSIAPCVATSSDACAPISAVPLNSEGVAAYPNGVTTLALGSHSISGTYSGDNSFLASTSGATAFTIVQSPTQVAVTTTGSGPVNLVASVTTLNSSGGVPPTGTISFYSGTTKLGTVNVTGATDPTSGIVSAAASLSVATAPASLTAVYSGDTNYTSANTAFTTVPSSYLASVTAGQTATYSFSITPAASFTGTATVACGAMPTGATCTVSPASVTLSGGTAATATVSVTTTAHTSAVPPPPAASSPQSWPGLWLAVLGLFSLLFGWLLFARRRLVIPAFAVLCLALGAAACGGGSSTSSGSSGTGTTGGGNTTTGTPAGSYTFLVTATSGSAIATQQLNLVVN